MYHYKCLNCRKHIKPARRSIITVTSLRQKHTDSLRRARSGVITSILKIINEEEKEMLKAPRYVSELNPLGFSTNIVKKRIRELRRKYLGR